MDFSVIIINLLLGIPIYFFWRWVLKRFSKNLRTKKLTIWAATLITTPLIYVAIITLWIFSISYFPSHRFTTQKWNSDKEKRYEISEDIINNKMLIGKTKTEIKQILGAEDNSEQSNHWTYYLGFRPSLFNIDPDVLDIEFKNGVVVRVSQHQT